MTKVFFGFALADSMFLSEAIIRKRKLTDEEVKGLVEAGVEPCLNPSHAATIAAMRGRYGIDVPIPPTPPKVCAGPGDRILVMGVRGLPRLTDRHEYTEEEVAAATFDFHLYSVE